MASPLHILNTVFGFPGFRGQQAEVISHMVDGGDALVLMPTGAGKSLCYQVPALCRDGIAVVVSPLIALMQNQVAALTQLGVRAAALNSARSFDEAAVIERQMRAGELDLLYVAPERLVTPGFLSLLDQCRIALFAIDEAHCVSQWGHDFRPEYLQLALLHERFPAVPRIALTATADGPTRKDIAERLGLGDGRIFVAGFDRPNIRYRITAKKNAKEQLLRFLEAEHSGDSGIVYCLSRAKVEEVAGWLTDKGYDALPYHAGLDQSVRAANQDRFLRDEAVVMVATIAFGMGIDKPDVRFVAHLDLPKSLESYYQETGRAGRDGLPANAWMAYGLEDVAKLGQFIASSQASDTQKRIERQKLNALLGLCETTRCRRQVLLEYFGESGAPPCGNCDICLEPVASFDGTELARKALSCVYRTGESFGAGHVIDVLLGKDTEKVQRFGHNGLSTFGIGAELAAEEWRSVLRQLVAAGYLSIDVEGHGAFRLTETCRPVLRGEIRVDLRRDPLPAKAKAKTATGKKAATQWERADDEALFQVLRAERMALAKAQGVPPYVILHDATLIEVARQRPRRAKDLADIAGLGETKRERYGDVLLAAVAAFEDARRLP
ncbi:DNA helicase RecQ [Paramagnetospirillum kuznetsovii]|uniref:DNA helicase RecQ n=1 Tax=Paramagnetospirillum kuznetsovii TaxID=2053833 RepID=A0A364NY08_9PROT|nr:DNA helicase RecQ [Paramagnetospirillum kuznetsovii]RAU21880.1 DNA helicase RecQ [Paramagnetospirillum kuznetsovii]